VYQHTPDQGHLHTLKTIQIHILPPTQETLTAQEYLHIQQKGMKNSLAQEVVHIHVPEVVHMLVLLPEQVQETLQVTIQVTTQDLLRVIMHVRLWATMWDKLLVTQYLT
jgi:hypothetical protein